MRFIRTDRRQCHYPGDGPCEPTLFVGRASEKASNTQMNRRAFVNPGSSSWWLLSLAPVLYFDRVRVSKEDLDSVIQQADNSAYHHSVAQVLGRLLAETGHELIVSDHGLPPRGRDPAIEARARVLTTEMIEAAESWSPTRPTLVRPGELKIAMTAAYRRWLEYNRAKARLLPSQDPLRTEIVGHQIPVSTQNLDCVSRTHARLLPELLGRNTSLRVVLENLVRNAILLTTMADGPDERAYDTLAAEFLPTVNLVERLRLFGSGRPRLAESARSDLLFRVHNINLARIASTASGRFESPEPRCWALFESASGSRFCGGGWQNSTRLLRPSNRSPRSG
jgi:hypothetical protein